MIENVIRRNFKRGNNSNFDQSGPFELLNELLVGEANDGENNEDTLEQN